MPSTLNNQLMTKSAATALKSARPRSILQRALFFKTSAPDSLAKQTVAKVPFDPTKKLTQTSVRMSRLKASVSKRTKDGFRERLFRRNQSEKGIRDGSKRKKAIREPAIFWKKKVCWGKNKRLSTLMEKDEIYIQRTYFQKH